MIDKLIFISGRLETLDYFVEKCMEGAKKLGVECYKIDAGNPESYELERLLAFVRTGGCAGFTFNQIGSLYNINGENFWDKYGIPLYDFMVDHPYNYVEALANPPKMMKFIVLDRNHEKFIRKYFPDIKDIYFMPNGGNESSGRLPYEKRTNDILYVGSCQPKICEAPALLYLADGGRQMYTDVVEIMMGNSFLTTEQAMEIYLDAYENGLEPKKRFEVIVAGIDYIQTIVRRHYKMKTMCALEETGATIEIYGDNWEDAGHRWGDNVHIHARVSSDECNRMLGLTRIGLNCMPWFKDGCSERVFNIMQNGAVCLTDTSSYLMERFAQGRELVFYELDDMESLKENVEWLLSNPYNAAEIAECGYRVATREDTWNKRMETLLGIV